MKFNPKLVYPVRDVITIRELVESSCEKFADNTAFMYREEDEIIKVTYEKFIKDIRALSTYLNFSGLQGEKIAVTGRNSYYWALTYMAVACGCGVVVPLDKDLPLKEAEYILQESEAKALMVSPELEEKFECSDICRKFYMKNIPEYISEGCRLIEAGDRSYADYKIDPNGLGVLIYTSGTTGAAKGVMLSQRNICSDITSVLKYVKINPDDVSVSVLPLHHTYECTAGFLGFIYSGACIAYNDSLRRIRADLAEFKPTVFIAVPLLLENFLKLILEKYASIPGGKTVFAFQKAASKLLPVNGNSSARKKLFSLVNESFGGRLRLILCGAAPLPPEIYKTYESFGIKVYIGYGLTETSPICLMHSDFYRSADDNGYPAAGIEAKICDADADGKGELAIRGNNVMLGYYKMPEETAHVIRDGWFYTGDLAVRCANGAIKIVGRLKSMIVAKNGKKIFPEELEYKIMQSGIVKECMVFGSGDPNSPVITAAIYPDEKAVADRLGISAETSSDEYKEAVKSLFCDAVEKINKTGMPYKAITKIIIREKEMEKTTTKKIRHNSGENMSDSSERYSSAAKE